MSRQGSGSEVNSELQIKVRGRLRLLVFCIEHALRFGGRQKIVQSQNLKLALVIILVLEG